ncbi:hypothetical protein Tco_0418900, partial [Tanacetum coccineum]
IYEYSVSASDYGFGDLPAAAPKITDNDHVLNHIKHFDLGWHRKEEQKQDQDRWKKKEGWVPKRDHSARPVGGLTFYQTETKA